MKYIKIKIKNKYINYKYINKNKNKYIIYNI